MDAWVVGLRAVCYIPSQHEKKSDQRMMWMSLVSGMVSLWGCCVSSMAGEFQEPASPAAPAYPDVDAHTKITELPAGIAIIKVIEGPGANYVPVI